MSVTTTAEPRTAPPSRPSRGIRVLRVIGWTLIAAGVVVLLYLVYSLFFTNLETDAAQAELRQEWEHTSALQEEQEAATAEPDVADTDVADTQEPPVEDEASPPDADGTGDDAPPPDIGSAVALVEFVRPGSDEAPVRDEPVVVVEGITREALTRGPGHYPESASPGADGNFAVAGHRTTYGAPFYRLDELEAGDEIHVTDRDGATHVYEFVEQRIVAPTDVWVLDPDPLGTDGALLTLTTCHPRFSARQRLVVFAELAS